MTYSLGYFWTRLGWSEHSGARSLVRRRNARVPGVCTFSAIGKPEAQARGCSGASLALRAPSLLALASPALWRLDIFQSMRLAKRPSPVPFHSRKWQDSRFVVSDKHESTKRRIENVGADLWAATVTARGFRSPSGGRLPHSNVQTPERWLRQR